MEVLLNKLFDKHSEGYGVYDRENLIKDICKEYQALQLLQTDVVGRSEQLKALLEKLLNENMCSVVGDELIEEALKGF